MKTKATMVFLVTTSEEAEWKISLPWKSTCIGTSRASGVVDAFKLWLNLFRVDRFFSPGPLFFISVFHTSNFPHKHPTLGRFIFNTLSFSIFQISLSNTFFSRRPHPSRTRLAAFVKRKRIIHTSLHYTVSFVTTQRLHLR